MGSGAGVARRVLVVAVVTIAPSAVGHVSDVLMAQRNGPGTWETCPTVSSLRAITAFAAVASDSDAPLAQRVQALCQQLDSDVRRERVQAARELLELGPRILPLLPRPDSLPSLAAREEVRRIRIHLERAQTRASTLPAKVTLEGRVRLREALEQIQKQTGNRIDASALPLSTLNRTCTVEFRQETFWCVLERLRTLAAIEFGPIQHGDVLRLVPVDGERRTALLGVDCSSAFRISAAAQPLRVDPQEPERRLLPIEFEVHPEPRLRTLLLQYTEADFRVTAASDKPLAPYSPDAKSELPLGTGRRQMLFMVPAGADLASLTLRGTFSAQVAAGIESFRFAGLTRESRKTESRGGVTVTLDSVAFREIASKGNEVRARLRITYAKAQGAFESHRTWLFHNRAYLEVNGTNRRDFDSLDTSLQTDGAVVIEYRFAPLPSERKECSLVYEAPTEIVDIPITFEIRRN